MEEGPEPQELMEQVSQSNENREEIEHKRKEKAFVTRSAITASVLAVGAALSSLLSGHAANDAIILQTKATDRWSYYQAKSTKLHVLEGNEQVVKALSGLLGKKDDPITKECMTYFDSQRKKFDDDKVSIEDEAQKIEKESANAFAKHQSFSLGVACFQIGIVLASVAILANANWLYVLSVGTGVLGLVYVVMGIIKIG